MKKPFFLLILILFSAASFSQTTISGRVLSREDRQPLPGSTVAVLVAGTQDLVTGAFTNEQGRFSVSNLAPGEYDLVITFIGYESAARRVLAGTLNNVLDMGTLLLEESRLEAGEVQIAAQRQAVSAALDRKSYVAESFISGSSGSALDIIKSLPGVVIDQEGRIVLRGSDKVAILIDGKQSSLTGFGNQKGLDNIPASQIESIEIINNPSAKYEAAGMAGIVNIIFRKSTRQGFSGDIGITPGIGTVVRRKADLPTGMPSYSANPKIKPAINLNYKTGKLNLYWQSYLLLQRSLPNNEFTTRLYDDGNITESQVAENRSQKHYNLKLGLDWNPAPKHTITLFGLYDYELHIDTTRVWYFGNQDYLDPLRKWGFNEREGTGFTNVTLQHKYRFQQEGHELNTQILFTKGWEDETYYLRQDGPAPFPVIDTDGTSVLAPEYIYHFSTDYTRPLPFGRIEAGVSGRMRHMPITYTISKDPENTVFIYDFGNWSEWDENLAGGYVNMVAEFAKTEIEAGLRAEYTGVSYSFAPNSYFSDDSYEYFSLFPNIRFTFKAGGSDRISLFYNRRIDRPGEDILRIFPKYDDPELLKIGNPSLRPQFTQNMELAYRHMWQKGSFYFSVYNKIIDDYFTRIYIQDPVYSEITVKAYDNLGKATNSGIEISLDQQVAAPWKLSASANVYRNRISAFSGQINFPAPQDYSIEERTDIPFFAKIINRFNISPGFNIEITGQYFSSKNIGQGRELARGVVDLGVRKSFGGDKMELSLTCSDILNTMGPRQEITGQGFRVEYQNFNETQVFSLYFRYRF